MDGNNISRVIWTIGGNRKFLDARCGLSPAYIKDFAMMHGKGGKNHAPRSGIQFTITDYSSANNGNKFLKANVPLSLIYKIKAVCEKNAGTTHGGIANIAGALTYSIGKIESACNALNQLAASGANSCQKLNTPAMTEQAKLQEIWTCLNSMKQVLDAGVNANPVTCVPPYTDFSYRQERVNQYKRDQFNNVYVSVCSVNRTQYRQDGSLSKLPWNINISNFWAAPNQHQNGTVSYNSSSVKDKTDAYISISDDDMYELIIHCDHYIRVWENVFCSNAIYQGWTATHQQNN